MSDTAPYHHLSDPKLYSDARYRKFNEWSKLYAPSDAMPVVVSAWTAGWDHGVEFARSASNKAINDALALSREVADLKMRYFEVCAERDKHKLAEAEALKLLNARPQQPTGKQALADAYLLVANSLADSARHVDSMAKHLFEIGSGIINELSKEPRP